MFVDGESIKWELNGRSVTANELLRVAVHMEATSWGAGPTIPHSTEEIARWLWEGALPPAEEIVPEDPPLGELLRSAIERGNGPACYYCGAHREMIERFEIDHVVPRSLGGSEAPSNKVLACKDCNRSKGARRPEGFRGKAARAYEADAQPTFFGELPEVRRVFGIETQTAKARHPDFRPMEDHPLSRMGSTDAR